MRVILSILSAWLLFGICSAQVGDYAVLHKGNVVFFDSRDYAFVYDKGSKKIAYYSKPNNKVYIMNQLTVQYEESGYFRESDCDKTDLANKLLEIIPQYPSLTRYDARVTNTIVAVVGTDYTMDAAAVNMDYNNALWKL